MTPSQCRMARAALGLSIRELAALTEMHHPTISNFERGGGCYASTVEKLQRALEAEGVVFVANGEASLSGGPGVRLRHSPDA